MVRVTRKAFRAMGRMLGRGVRARSGRWRSGLRPWRGGQTFSFTKFAFKDPFAAHIALSGRATTIGNHLNIGAATTNPAGLQGGNMVGILLHIGADGFTNFAKITLFLVALIIGFLFNKSPLIFFRPFGNRWRRLHARL